MNNACKVYLKLNFFSTKARYMLLDLRIWYISISAMIASGFHLPITHSKQVLKKKLKNTH